MASGTAKSEIKMAMLCIVHHILRRLPLQKSSSAFYFLCLFNAIYLVMLDLVLHTQRNSTCLFL